MGQVAAVPPRARLHVSVGLQVPRTTQRLELDRRLAHGNVRHVRTLEDDSAAQHGALLRALAGIGDGGIVQRLDSLDGDVEGLVGERRGRVEHPRVALPRDRRDRHLRALERAQKAQERVPVTLLRLCTQAGNGRTHRTRRCHVEEMRWCEIGEEGLNPATNPEMRFRSLAVCVKVAPNLMKETHEHSSLELFRYHQISSPLCTVRFRWTGAGFGLST